MLLDFFFCSMETTCLSMIAERNSSPEPGGIRCLYVQYTYVAIMYKLNVIVLKNAPLGKSSKHLLTLLVYQYNTENCRF
jgi:hypothetical protein